MAPTHRWGGALLTPPLITIRGTAAPGRDIPATTCLSNFTFLTRLLFYTFSPLALLVLMTLPSLWAKSRRNPALDKLLDRFFHWSSWLLYLVFPMVSRVDFSALVCDDLGEDGQRLSTDYRVDCNSPAWQDVIRIFGWIGVG